MDVRIGEQRLDGIVGLDLAAVLGAQRRGVERTGGVDCRDLRLAARVDGIDVGRGSPSIADDGDVVFFAHGIFEEREELALYASAV